VRTPPHLLGSVGCCVPGHVALHIASLRRSECGSECPQPCPAGTLVHAAPGGRPWSPPWLTALDLHVPGEGPAVIETIGMGELLGWSWLFPPYRWAFGAVTTSPLEAFEFDAKAVRARCAADPALDHELTQRVAQVLARRLQATRVRLVARSGRAASLY
jgi:hypothetical protein